MTTQALTTEAMQKAIRLNAAGFDSLAHERPEYRGSRAKNLAIALRHYNSVVLVNQMSNDLPSSLSFAREAGGDLLDCPCTLRTSKQDGFATVSLGGDACFKLTELANASPFSS